MMHQVSGKQENDLCELVKCKLRRTAEIRTRDQHKKQHTIRVYFPGNVWF